MFYIDCDRVFFVLFNIQIAMNKRYNKKVAMADILATYIYSIDTICQYMTQNKSGYN